jgi:hypothetical protein
VRSGGQLRPTALTHERAIIDHTHRQIGAIRKWARSLSTKTAAGEGAELGGFTIDQRVFVQSQMSGAKDRLKTFLKSFC